MRLYSTTALTATTLTSALLLVGAATLPARAIERAGSAHSPVRCAAAVPDEAPASGRQPALQVFDVAPPPPPPAPPSLTPPGVVPPPAMVEPSADIVLTATRAPRAKGFHLARPRAPYGSAENRERYDGKPVASIQDVAAQPVSTFSVDVDTGAYANVRRMLDHGEAVPADAVRTEEFVNYFRYDYPRPQTTAQPFSITADVARTPWNAATRLLRVGLRAYDVPSAARPPANLVFLVDTSGSMDEPDKLPLVKQALAGLADQLRPDDRVAIVAYAGSAGIVLEPTAGKDYVKAALSCLDAGGSTAGGEGIELAYATARASFVKGGINRIFLATDGDFNVGISDTKALEALVKRNRDDGITLTTLGFGEGNYNDAMMEHIADVGNGNYGYIDSAAEARKVLEDELSATLVTVAKDVKVQVEFNPAEVSQYRLIGYENRALAEEDFRNDAVDAGDMGAGHQVTALYEVVPAGSAGWTPERRYPANRPPAPMSTGGVSTGGELAFVRLRYKLPAGGPSRELSRPVPASALAAAAPPAGDMAFATAVAAFGQKLRGDKYLGGYGYADIRALAGSPSGQWRQQFVALTRLADRGNGAVRGTD